MKISGDAGHNCYPDTGSTGYKKEDNLTKEVWTLVQSKLKSIGVETVDCTPYNMRFSSVNNSLAYRVNKANASKSDLHLCIHFNAGGGTGVECYVVGTGGKAETYAKSICREIASLGFRNRGVKVANFYIPRYTNMSCVLIECAFVDSKADMDRYNGEKMANAIVKAVTGQDVSSNSNSSNNNSENTNNNSGNTNNNGSAASLVTNAVVTNDWLYIRDSSGNILSGRIEIGTKIKVLDVFYGKQLVLIEYILNNVVNKVYVTNATNCIVYDYAKEWANGSTPEIVYETSSCTNSIGSIYPYEKATPIYRENGILHVVYDTDKGENTKSGFVKYNDSFAKF
ncbi:MAG: N-acetylmuramoyl-L-alanine amidase [Clostridium perfringens]|nr:N-acetylmuramoyl-L-alanine amidase [Clostridium perfringens]